MAPEQDDVRRVLVVVAHPDDVDFGAGGTIAAWTAAGVEVAYCIATSGEAGGFDPAVPREQIPEIRQREQRAAAKVLGVEDVTFLGYRDGELTVSIDLRRDIARQIRRVRPDRVLTTTPVRNFARIGISHPDHLAIGEATLCAVYPDARNPFAYPELLRAEGLEAHVVREVWLQGSEQPNRVVDVTDTFDKKIEALLAHESQTAHEPEMPEGVRGWLTTGAQNGGLPDGRLAESFRVVPTA